MEEASIQDLLGDECYIMCPISDDCESMNFGSMTATSYLIELTEELLIYDATECGEYIAVHGVLTPADAIPQELHSTITPFILVVDEGQVIGSIVRPPDYCTPVEVAKIVEQLVSGDEEGNFAVPMDQIYILYGYEVPLRLTVEEDDTDEALIETGKNIASTVNQLLTLHAEE